MTRDQFFDILTKEERASPGNPLEDQEQMQKMADAISMKLDNKLSTELQKIRDEIKNIKKEEVQNNVGDHQAEQGVKQEGAVQNHEESGSNPDQGS